MCRRISLTAAVCSLAALAALVAACSGSPSSQPAVHDTKTAHHKVVTAPLTVPASDVKFVQFTSKADGFTAKFPTIPGAASAGSSRVSLESACSESGNCELNAPIGTDASTTLYPTFKSSTTFCRGPQFGSDPNCNSYGESYGIAVFPIPSQYLSRALQDTEFWEECSAVAPAQIDKEPGARCSINEYPGTTTEYIIVLGDRLYIIFGAAPFWKQFLSSIKFLNPPVRKG